MNKNKILISITKHKDYCFLHIILECVAHTNLGILITNHKRFKLHFT